MCLGKDTRGCSKAFPKRVWWGGVGVVRAETSPVVHSGALRSGFPAFTSHTQTPGNPAPDHTLASLRPRKLSQVPEGIRALWGRGGEGGHLHERPRPLSGYEEGQERGGDALLSCGATEGRTP